jgi:hypothetical protein
VKGQKGERDGMRAAVGRYRDLWPWEGGRSVSVWEGEPLDGCRG